MQFRISDDDLKQWVNRRNAIQAIEGSEGWQIMLARITQERRDAEESLLGVNRWNWFKILKLLIQRDTAQALLNYVEGCKKMGDEAEEALGKSNPQWKKESGRPVFVSSPLP